MISVWRSDSQLPEFERLERDITADVLVIGGGMAGILTAYLLKQKGAKCVLVEKDRICGGVTGNTTAKITFQHGLIYDKILKSGGTEKARMYLDAGRAAFDEFARLCGGEDSAGFGYEIKDNYVYSVSDRAKLEREISALEKIGYSAQLCENIPIPIDTAGAVRFADQAQFNPLNFISHIAGDLDMYENTRVCEMIGNEAKTEYGSISAKQVVVATHFPFINKHGSYFIKLYQHRSYVLALENAQNVDGMYVDENKKGMSFRNYGEYLLIGGGGHRTGKKGGCWDELRDFAERNYPGAREKYFWAAQDCMSLDSVPYIGHYSKRTADMYVASGFNKWGMTGSMTAAMILSDMITGRRNEFAEVFDPSRSILKPQLFVNGFEAVINLLTPTTKRCPHMGCALKWNGTEHSWDCPCHGSRFDGSGRVIENPANGDLKK